MAAARTRAGSGRHAQHEGKPADSCTNCHHLLSLPHAELLPRHAQTASLVASAVLFSLWQVPLGTALASGSPSLLLFQALGAWLAFLYQKSGGSLPFAVATHCTFNALVTLLRSAQMTSTLPF